MNVRFGDVDEFVRELERDPYAVARKLVRVTTLSRPAMSGAITCVSVVATAKVLSGTAGHEDYDLVELEIYAGDLWRGPTDDATRETANNLVHQISETLAAAGFVTATGRYEQRQAK